MFEISCFMNVICYPYRTATIKTVFLSIDRMSEEGKKLEKELAEKAGVATDNHVVYALESYIGDSDRMYFFCSDSHIHVGNEIVEKYW